MTRTVWLALAIAINAIVVTVSQAQTNSYISTNDGFWDEARLWSLAVPPSISQSGIFITNAASVNVTIDSLTADSFPDSLTISNLTINPAKANNSVLYLDDTGTNALHIIEGFTIAFSASDHPAGGASLVSSNSTLIVDGLQGGQLLDNGSIIIAGGSLLACELRLLCR